MNSHQVSRARQYLGDVNAEAYFHVQDYHLLWSVVPDRSVNKLQCVCLFRFGMTFPRPHVRNGLTLHVHGLDCYRFARRY